MKKRRIHTSDVRTGMRISPGVSDCYRIGTVVCWRFKKVTTKKRCGKRAISFHVKWGQYPEGNNETVHTHLLESKHSYVWVLEQ